MNRLGLYLGLIAAGCILLILRHDEANVFGLQHDEFASLVWSGVLALVLAAGLLADRSRILANLRYLLVWAVAILVLVTIHVYRSELQDVASRVTAGLIPGRPVSRDRDGNAEVELIRSLDGHFRTRASVNGAPVELVVDTGASTVVLSDGAATRAGIDVSALVYSARVETANGRATAAPVTLEEVQIGGIGRRRVRALVARPGALETNLLGMSFLETLSRYEFRGDRLVLAD